MLLFFVLSAAFVVDYVNKLYLHAADNGLITIIVINNNYINIHIAH